MKETFQNESQHKAHQLSDLQQSFEMINNENTKLNEINKNLTKELSLKTKEMNNVNLNLQKSRNSNKKLQEQINELQNRLR